MCIVESVEENAATPGPSLCPSLPANEGFNRDQTLFFIDLMHQYLETEDGGLPKTFREVNSRLKSARSNKKNLWKETSEKLSSHFSESFCPEKVARKWNTLVDGYKKIKDKNRSMGQGPLRFQFFREMDDILGGHHDVIFPVVGTSAGVDIRRPEVLGLSGVMAPPTKASCSTPHAAPTRPHKLRREANDILHFLRESEDASQRRHEELLTQLKSAQKGFEDLMSQLSDKL